MESEFSYIYWCSEVEADNSALWYLVSLQYFRRILDNAVFSDFIIKIDDIEEDLNLC